MRGKRMHMRKFAVALGVIIAGLAAVLGPPSLASASTAEPHVKQAIVKPTEHRAAKKAGFSCGGKTYASNIVFNLQGSGGRIGYQMGTNSGRTAVRMWRVSGGNANFSIASLPSGGGAIVNGVYEHCSVLPAGSTGASLWAQIPGIGQWSQNVPF